MFFYITVILSAMQVVLATDKFAGDIQFQQFSYGIYLLSIAFVLAAVGAMFFMWASLFWFRLFSTSQYHRKAAFQMHNLALNLSRQTRFNEAEALQRHMLEVLKKDLGEEHRRTPDATVLGLMRDCVFLRAKVLGPDDPKTVYVTRILANWEAGSEADSKIDLKEHRELAWCPRCLAHHFS